MLCHSWNPVPPPTTTTTTTTTTPFLKGEGVGSTFQKLSYLEGDEMFWKRG